MLLAVATGELKMKSYTCIVNAISSLCKGLLNWNSSTNFVTSYEWLHFPSNVRLVVWWMSEYFNIWGYRNHSDDHNNGKSLFCNSSNAHDRLMTQTYMFCLISYWLCRYRSLLWPITAFQTIMCFNFFSMNKLFSSGCLS